MKRETNQHIQKTSSDLEIPIIATKTMPCLSLVALVGIESVNNTNKLFRSSIDGRVDNHRCASRLIIFHIKSRVYSHFLVHDSWS